ncbi:MAG TPA: hypothetical protein VKB10_06505 [Gaiellaceae bacterium]|nr:hypothetical protein [Gaiellaceae bacterium]
MAKQPKDYVKKHLSKNDVDPETLPDGVIDALNAFSEEELKRVDNLGEQLEEAGGMTPGSKISAVH